MNGVIRAAPPVLFGAACLTCGIYIRLSRSPRSKATIEQWRRWGLTGPLHSLMPGGLGFICLGVADILGGWLGSLVRDIAFVPFVAAVIFSFWRPRFLTIG